MNTYQILGIAILSLTVMRMLYSFAGANARRRTEKGWLRLVRKEFQLAEANLNRSLKTLDSGWTGNRKFRVEAKMAECEDVYSFYLSPHDKQPIPPFNPGQHLTITLHPPGDKPLVRCYSLSDSVGHGRFYRISVKHLRGRDEQPDGRASSFLHQSIRVGDTVDLKAPKGKFFLNEQSNQPVFLIAGGIGMTPMLSMVNHLAETNRDRLIYFLYGAQNSNQVAQMDYLKKLSSTWPQFKLRFVFSRPLDGDIAGHQDHREGHVTIEQIRDMVNGPEKYLKLEPADRLEFYLCGPGPMMQAVTGALEDWGVPDEDINYEAFGPSSVKKAKKPDEAGETKEAEARSFPVEFRRSGKKLIWTSDKGSLLDFAESEGVVLDSGCCCGECGTCETAILSGDVVYPDREPEADVPQGSCLVCIGEPGSALVLDA